MVRLTTALVASLLATAVTALPVQKRNAQIITGSITGAWADACGVAGGADQCTPISLAAFQALLATAKNCDQQDVADQMIDFAKKLNSNPEMIRLAQLFVQQPRNAPDRLQVPYCQTAPKNAELNGLFHCQFASSDFTKFSGDQTGNLPLGVSAVTPPGSCPAKTDGPVPDGAQINTLETSPGNVAARAVDTTKTPPEVEQLLRRFKFVDKVSPQVEQLFQPSATLEDKTSLEIAQLFQRSPHSPHHAHQHGSNAAAGSIDGLFIGNTGFQFIDKTSPEVEQLKRRSSFQFVDKTPPELEHIHLGVGAPSPFTPEIEGDTDPLVPDLNGTHDLTTRYIGKYEPAGAPRSFGTAFASPSPHGPHHAHGASSVNQAIPLAASPIVAATSPQPTLAQAPGFPPGTNSQFIEVA